MKRGLLPTMFIAAVALASCSTMPRSPPGQIVADKALTQHIYLALNAEPYYYFRHVDVRVDDGVVVLTGWVWGPDAFYRAREIARGVPGVTRVVTSNLAWRSADHQ